MRRHDGADALPLAGAAAAVIAVACSAGAPALGAALGGLTLVVVLGVTGGVIATAAVIANVALVLRSRKRHRGALTSREAIP